MKPMFRCLTLPLKLPSGMPRLESGVVRFNDDWPGVFLRGDYAGPAAHSLRQILDKLPKEDWAAAGLIESLCETLESCNTKGLPLEQMVAANT